MEILWNKLFIAVCLITLTTISTYDSVALDGMVPRLQTIFQINNSQTAMVKTISLTATTIVLLLMWLAGDRISRRPLLLSAGVLWSIGLGASLLSGIAELFWAFIIARTILACASAIIAIIVPVILADLFTEAALGHAIMTNMFLELIGTLCAVPLSSITVTAPFAWQIIFIPALVLGMTATVVLYCILPATSYADYDKRDVLDSLKIFRVKSYVLLTIAIVMVNWFTKVTYFWVPSFVLSAWSYKPDAYFGLPYPAIMTSNSFIELVASAIGLPVWITIAESWQYGRHCFRRFGISTRALPGVAAITSIGLLTSSLLQTWAGDVSYIAMAIGAFLFGFSAFPLGSVVTQMILTVSCASRRASALSLMKLLSTLVVIPGPQIIGALADVFYTDPTSAGNRFHSYQKALYINNLTMIGTVFFLIATIFTYPQDAQNVHGPLLSDPEETAPLIGSRLPSRRASLLEKSVMSRRATMENMAR